MIWKPFYITCSCGHRNRPHNSPREGVKMALLNQLKPCTKCGEPLPAELPDRPLVQEVRQALQEQGLLPES